MAARHMQMSLWCNEVMAYSAQYNITAHIAKPHKTSHT